MWQNFFDRPKRNYNPYMERMRDYPFYIQWDKETINAKKSLWKEHFQNDNEIYLEIGSGQGNFTVANALRYQNKNFLGIELKFKRLCMSAVKAEKRSLKNITFIRRWGQEILEFIGEGEISGMFINFPDRWDGNEKNRIISEDLFKKTLASILKKDGKLFFKTDHTGYYEDVLALMPSIEGFKVTYSTDDLHNDPRGFENIKTEFEELFTKKGISTKFIEITKEF